MMREVAAGVFVLEAEQRFYGLEIGTRMTVLQLEEGLLLHSPVSVSPASLEPLGTLKWVLAPNLFHHLYVGPFIEAGAEAWGAPGLSEKRPDLSFSGTLDETGSPFGEDLLVVPLRCFPFSNEVVVLHRPSGTLIVTDLLFNLQPTAPWTTRWAFRCLCGYPGVKTTLLERAAMKREIARRELAFIQGLDFDRVVLAHGDIIESGGREALRSAFHWLG